MKTTGSAERVFLGAAGSFAGRIIQTISHATWD